MDATPAAAPRPTPAARRAEHVFAPQKARLGMVIRTVGVARARAAVALANMTRWRWLNGRAAPA